jgi:drug/metabolite transporter (DMT)-like permease
MTFREDEGNSGSGEPKEAGSRSRLASLALAFAGCLWGTGFFFGKIAFREMSVTENVSFRFVCGSVVLLPFLWRKWKPFCRRQLAMLLVASVVGIPIQFLIQFKGLQLTTVSHASIIVGTLPMMLALGSTVFLHERLNRVEWGILLLSALGALLIALSGLPLRAGPQTTTQGDLLVWVSMIAAVGMILISKRLFNTHDPLQITASMIVAGTVILLVCAEIWQPLRFQFSAKAWMAVGAQGGLATAGAYLCWNWGLARVPASRSAVFLNLEPIVGTLLGLVFLHEMLNLTAVLGGTMILGSAVYVSRRDYG